MPQLSQETRERWFGRLFGVLSVASIAGITLGVTGVFGTLMDTGFRPNQRAALQALALCGWVVICILAYRAKRHKEFPATWAVLLVVALVWAALLLNRLG